MNGGGRGLVSTLFGTHCILRHIIDLIDQYT